MKPTAIKYSTDLNRKEKVNKKRGYPERVPSSLFSILNISQL